MKDQFKRITNRIKSLKDFSEAIEPLKNEKRKIIKAGKLTPEIIQRLDEIDQAIENLREEYFGDFDKEFGIKK